MMRMRDDFLLGLTNEDVWEKYFNLEYVLPEFINPIRKEYKISICTTCMGRTYDLKKTYVTNLIDNIETYPNTEFVLLNYNSNDDMDDFVKHELSEYIKEGYLNYYKTIEPKFYSMTHSRNIAFKIASGDIVNNVDADHLTLFGFSKRINEIANQFDTDKLVFIKSKQTNRGRLGFFKSRFIDDLGGYDESFGSAYGFDDEDILCRAYHLGFTITKFTGDFCQVVEHHKRHFIDNYPDKDWKYTQRRNALISLCNIACKKFKANMNQHWGKAHLIKNFEQEIDI